MSQEEQKGACAAEGEGTDGGGAGQGRVPRKAK